MKMFNIGYMDLGRLSLVLLSELWSNRVKRFGLMLYIVMSPPGRRQLCVNNYGNSVRDCQYFCFFLFCFLCVSVCNVYAIINKIAPL